MDPQQLEVVQYWRQLIGTLGQRGLLKQRPRQGGVMLPTADAILLPDRCIFILDLQRLAGIRREQWLDPALWAQWQAALEGRRVVVSDGSGLAIQVSRQPGQRQHERIPRRVVLTPEKIPAGDYTALLGFSKTGPVVLDLAEGERALLVGGTSGSGKTGTIISLVLQLARKNEPEGLSLAIVDLKRLDFTQLAGLPHLAQPVATIEPEAATLVRQCVQEMERRQVIMNAVGVNKWDLLPAEERFPLLLVVIDEAADFDKSQVMEDLVELARKSRACGIALIAATQRPDADVFSPQAKANFTTRIAFQTVDRGNSQVILDRTGAEKLTRTGLCLTNAGGQWRKVQAAYVPEGTLGGWLDIAPAGPVLDDVERALVAYARDELSGAFTVGKLYDALRDGQLEPHGAKAGDISKDGIAELAQRWERRGWLTEPAHATDSRRVTDDLLDLIALSAPIRRISPISLSGQNVQGAGAELPPFLTQKYSSNGNAPGK
ncbi:MAG: DNA translocase FtsK [Anaerolineae bacterium]|nr:DNA translocase FtsK [Anaerolineae bacterium]